MYLELSTSEAGDISTMASTVGKNIFGKPKQLDNLGLHPPPSSLSSTIPNVFLAHTQVVKVRAISVIGGAQGSAPSEMKV